jgi:(2R)-ethylmalonyl-CoA mutase
MKDLGVGDIPVIVGGIIPEADAAALKAEGVVRVYTPKDFALTRIIADIVELVDGGTKEAA